MNDNALNDLRHNMEIEFILTSNDYDVDFKLNSTSNMPGWEQMSADGTFQVMNSSQLAFDFESNAYYTNFQIFNLNLTGDFQDLENSLNMTLTIPVFDQTLNTQFDLNEAEETVTMTASYNSLQHQMSADFSLNYGEVIDYKLLLKSNIAGWEQMSFDGKFDSIYFIVISNAQWSESDSFEFTFAHNFKNITVNMVKSSAHLENITLSANLDLNNTKAEVVFVNGKDKYQSNVAITASELTQWSAKFMLTSPQDKHSLDIKFELENSKREILFHLQSIYFPVKLQISTASRSERQLLTASVSIPSLGVQEWRLNADTSKGTTARIIVFWAPRQSISLNLINDDSKLSFKLKTPFEIVKTLAVVCSYHLTNRNINTIFTHNNRKVIVNVSMPNDSSVSMQITTPFHRFRQISFNANLIYQQLQANPKRDCIEAAFAFAASLNNKKITFEMAANTSGSEAADFAVNISTPFKGFNKVSLHASFELTPIYKLAFGYNDDRQVFKFLSSFESAETDTEVVFEIVLNTKKLSVVAALENQSKAWINIQTPFNGFRKINLGLSLVTDTDFAAKLSYQQDRYLFELNGKYESSPSGLNAEFNVTNNTPYTAFNQIDLAASLISSEKHVLTMSYNQDSYHHYAIVVELTDVFPFAYQPAFSVMVKTPIKGFKVRGLNGSVSTDPSWYAATVYYKQDDYLTGLEAEFKVDEEEDSYDFKLKVIKQDDKITADVAVRIDNQPNAMIRITTPFKGFNKLSLNVTLAQDPVYLATVSYSQDRYAVGFKGTLKNVHPAEDAAEDPLSLSLEGNVNKHKITLDASLLMGNQPNASVVITTPFKGFNKLSLMASFETDPEYVATLIYKQDGTTSELKGKFANGMATEEPLSFNVKGTVNGQEITLDTSLFIGNQPNASIVITTPFKGFSELSLNAGFETDPEYSVTLTYKQDGFSSEIQGKFANSNADEEPLTFGLEGSVNDQKITLDVSLLMGNQPNASIVITTPFEGFHELSLNANFATEPEYAATLNYKQDGYSSQLKGKFSNGDGIEQNGEEHVTISLEGSLNDQTITLNLSAVKGNQHNASLVITTPFEGFNELSLTATVVSDPDYVASLTYNQDGFSSQLQGKFSKTHSAEDETEEAFNLNLVGGIGDQNITVDVSLLNGNQPNASIVIRTPFEGFSELSLNAGYETDPENAATLTYKQDGFVSELKGKFSNRNAAEDATDEPLNLSLEGGINDQKITMDISLVMGDQPQVAIMVTTPFEGFNDLSLNASYETDPEYTATLTYKQDGFVSELKGNFANGNATEEPLTFSLEGSLNDQKITLDVSLLMGSQPNASLAITTPFDLLRNAKLTAFNKEDITFRLEKLWMTAFEYNDHKVTFKT